MNKKLSSILIIGLFAAGVGLAIQQPTAYAKGFIWLKTKDYSTNPPIYMANEPGRSVAMWNWNHTKKLHNLRNYPYTKWKVMKSVKMYNPKKTWGNKTGIYYKLVSGKKTGYVHRNFVNKVKPKSSSNQTANNKNLPPIVLTQNKTILSLFPGTIYRANKILFPENTEDYKSNTTTIYPDDASLALYNQVLDKKMTYKAYVLSVLKKQNINPNNYQGYGIGVQSFDPNAKYTDGSDEGYSTDEYKGGQFVISISPLKYWR